jgi:hypothetical protein
MELIILIGLALFILLAASAERGEPEVETFIITRPVAPAQRRPFSTIIFIAMLGLIVLVVLQQLAAVSGR